MTVRPISSDYLKLTDTDLAPVQRPIAEATGLPNGFYVGASALELEFDRIFAPSWFCIGFAKDIPAAGDARPVTVLGRPLLMLRDRAGAIRVFHNVCSHRGMTLVAEPTSRLRVIRCPYHHWCYDLSGELGATPHLGGAGVHEHPEFDPTTKGLKSVRSAVWFDLVFVNLSGDGQSFEDFIAPLAKRWSDFAEAPLVHGGEASSDRLEVACNWKLAVENYCEAYHLPAVHPELNSYSRIEDHFDIDEPGSFAGQGSSVYTPMLSKDGRGFPAVPGLPERWSTGADYIALFPNLLLGIHKDHFFALRLDPVAVDRTVEEIEIYYFDEACAGGDYADLRRANQKLWRQVFLEDVGVIEGMQRGRHSVAFQGGAFSPAMDGPTHSFHKWVAERLAGDGPEPA